MQSNAALIKCMHCNLHCVVMVVSYIYISTCHCSNVQVYSVTDCNDYHHVH